MSKPNNLIHEKSSTKPLSSCKEPNKVTDKSKTDEKIDEKSSKILNNTVKESKKVENNIEKPKAEDKEDKSKMATKPPLEKSNSKVNIVCNY